MCTTSTSPAAERNETRRPIRSSDHRQSGFGNRFRTVVRTVGFVGVVVGSSTLVLSACGSKAPAAVSDSPFGTGACVAADGSAPQQRVFTEAPAQCIDTAKHYTATMVTTKGTMVFHLDPTRAPVTVNSFVNLARAKYFDGIYFHRVVPNFVLQAGDPQAVDPSTLATAGAGGPGYRFDDELPQSGEYTIGSLAMANAGENTNGSQFFIISGAEGTALPPKYALFGQLDTDPASTATMQAIAALGQTDGPPSEPVRIESVTITEG